MVVKTFASEDTQIFLPSGILQSFNNEGQDNQLAHIKDILANFVGSLAYSPPDTMMQPRTTYPSLCSEFAAYNNGGAWFEALSLQAATMAELSYPDHPFEIQLQIARFTWFLIYVDDLGQKFPLALEGFQERIFANESPEGSFLQAFRAHLSDMYQFWDTIPANCINIAAMDYLNGCLLEEMPLIRDMKVSPHTLSWLYYLRNKTGSAYAYAFMLFPKAIHPDMSTYIQVIEDLTVYTNLVNDVLSFYKEYLAGETNNYISNRAKATQQSLIEALKDTANEVLAAHARISKILESTDAHVPWKRFVNGYLAFHFGLERYRLSDLGF